MSLLKNKKKKVEWVFLVLREMSNQAKSQSHSKFSSSEIKKIQAFKKNKKRFEGCAANKLAFKKYSWAGEMLRR